VFGKEFVKGNLAGQFGDFSTLEFFEGVVGDFEFDAYNSLVLFDDQIQ